MRTYIMTLAFGYIPLWLSSYVKVVAAIKCRHEHTYNARLVAPCFEVLLRGFPEACPFLTNLLEGFLPKIDIAFL